MCRVNNKDTRTMVLASIWCLYIFTPCSSVSIVYFEHVIAAWDYVIFRLETNELKYNKAAPESLRANL